MTRRTALTAAVATIVPVSVIRGAPIPPLKKEEEKNEHMIFFRPDEAKYIRPCGCEKRSAMVALSTGDTIITSLSARKVTTAIREAEHNKQKWVEVPPADCQCAVPVPVFHGAAPVMIGPGGGVVY